jgi:hypothetical protein
MKKARVLRALFHCTGTLGAEAQCTPRKSRNSVGREAK